MSFQEKERSKTRRKHKKSHLRGCLRRTASAVWEWAGEAFCFCPRHPTPGSRLKSVFLLFIKLNRWKKPSFLDLNPKQPHAINRDSCTLFYSFRNINGSEQGSNIRDSRHNFSSFYSC